MTKFAEQRQKVAQLTAKLESATSAGKKQVAIEEWRLQNEVFGTGRLRGRYGETARTAHNVLAHLESKDPLLASRVLPMELRLAATETLKVKLEEIKHASGEERAKIVEDFRRDHENLGTRQVANAAVATMGENLAPENVSLEVRKRLARHEQRKCEIDQLKDSLNSGITEIKEKAVEGFRAQNAERRIEAQRNVTEKRENMIPRDIGEANYKQSVSPVTIKRTKLLRICTGWSGTEV